MVETARRRSGAPWAKSGGAPCKVRKIIQREEAVVPDEGVGKRLSCWRENRLAGFIAPHGLFHRPEKISHQAAVLPICNRAGKASGSKLSGSLLD
jgi:hypothetical protein